MQAFQPSRATKPHLLRERSGQPASQAAIRTFGLLMEINHYNDLILLRLTDARALGEEPVLMVATEQ